MNLTEDCPCKLDLNDHGGVTLKFKEFVISNTVGGQWCLTVTKNEQWINISPLEDSIYRAFYVATQEKNLQP